MDDLYGNAWGDPLNDYPNQPYALPTWNTKPLSPRPPSPVEADKNDNHANDDEDEVLSTETQFRTHTSDASWTADAVPWPVENHNSYNSVWVSTSPANVWGSAAQPQTPTCPTPASSDDVSPNASPLASPLNEELKEEHPVSSGEAQDTPIQSRASSPEQFGTFESGNTDTTISVEEVGWASPKYSPFDDSADSSNAWVQQTTAKEPVDEWEAARRTKEKLDRRVVRLDSRSFGSGDLLSVCFSPRRSSQASLKHLKHSLRKCGQKTHRVAQVKKRSGSRLGDVVSIVSKACA